MSCTGNDADMAFDDPLASMALGDLTVPDDLRELTASRATIGCVIPAYNESDSIAGVLDALLNQTRPPDVIHVIVNNTTDDTVDVASHYAGVHARLAEDGEHIVEVFVHDIGESPEKKVGALNYGFFLVEGCDYLLGADGDTTPEPTAVQDLLDEIESDPRIGGVSAIYSIDDSALSGPMAQFLIAGQRAQFAAFNMQNLLRGRNMAVLGGQFSLFSVQALREVMRQSHQQAPWVKDSEVEDSLLSLQIKNAGYLTKISATARAHVGGMTTLRALDGQQVKWNFGAIELMWPGQRGDTKGQPLHPNLRLRWFEHFSMVMNTITRFMFVTLVLCSIWIDAFVFSAWWIIPPAAAIVLNTRVARSMHHAHRRDFLFALLLFPAEFYMWVRIGHFLRAWAKFFSRQQTDNWAAQARAERGAGHGYLLPYALCLGLIVAVFAAWVQLPLGVQSDVLTVSWPVLGVLTIAQTAWMIVKIFRTHRGYRV